MTLTLLLCNAYNAPWPKDFSPEAFCYGEDLTPVLNDRDIKELSPEDQVHMAEALVFENKDMKGGVWYGTYLAGLEILLAQEVV